MIVFFLPVIIFIVIAVVIGVFFAGALPGIASNIGAIIVIAWIIIGIMSLANFIANFVRGASIPRKIAGAIVVAAAIAVSIMNSCYYFPFLKTAAEMVESDSYNFFDAFVFGGIVWLISIGLCEFASYRCITDEGEKLFIGYFGNIALVALSALISLSFFGPL